MPKCFELDSKGMRHHDNLVAMTSPTNATNAVKSGWSSKHSGYKINYSGMNGGNEKLLKVGNSCEHSITQITPNYRQKNNASSTSNKNQKQPFQTLVPGRMKKNLSKDLQNAQNNARRFSNAKLNQANESGGNRNKIMYCEESEIMMKSFTDMHKDKNS